MPMPMRMSTVALVCIFGCSIARLRFSPVCLLLPVCLPPSLDLTSPLFDLPIVALSIRPPRCDLIPSHPISSSQPPVPRTSFVASFLSTHCPSVVFPLHLAQATTTVFFLFLCLPCSVSFWGRPFRPPSSGHCLVRSLLERLSLVCVHGLSQTIRQHLCTIAPLFFSLPSLYLFVSTFLHLLFPHLHFLLLSSSPPPSLSSTSVFCLAYRLSLLPSRSLTDRSFLPFFYPTLCPPPSPYHPRHNDTRTPSERAIPSRNNAPFLFILSSSSFLFSSSSVHGDC